MQEKLEQNIPLANSVHVIVIITIFCVFFSIVANTPREIFEKIRVILYKCDLV